jgi:hypothetical protein
VCAKLHNIRINRWLLRGKGGSDRYGNRGCVPVPDHEDIVFDEPEEKMIKKSFENRYRRGLPKPKDNELRRHFSKTIWDSGIRVDENVESQTYLS